VELLIATELLVTGRAGMVIAIGVDKADIDIVGAFKFPPTLEASGGRLAVTVPLPVTIVVVVVPVLIPDNPDAAVGTELPVEEHAEGTGKGKSSASGLGM